MRVGRAEAPDHRAFHHFDRAESPLDRAFHRSARAMLPAIWNLSILDVSDGPGREAPHIYQSPSPDLFSPNTGLSLLTSDRRVIASGTDSSAVPAEGKEQDLSLIHI